MRSYRLFVLSVFMSVLIAGCSQSMHASTVTPNVGGVSIPQVVQQQGSGSWVTLPLNKTNEIEQGQAFVAGFDDAVWYCGATFVNRVSMSDIVTATSVPNCWDLTSDPDGNLYFVADQSKATPRIGRIDSTGHVTFVSLSLQTVATFMSSDNAGNLWVGQNADYIHRITPGTGNVVTFRIASPDGSEVVFTGITQGSDGSIWYSCKSANGAYCYGYITQDGSTSQSWVVPQVSPPIAASDNGIWFSEGLAVARVDPSTKSIVTYPVSNPINAVAGVQGTPDHIYFLTKGHQLVNYNIHTHAELAGVTIPSDPGDMLNQRLVKGPDRNLWVPGNIVHTDDDGTSFEVYVLRALSTSPTSITVSVGQDTPLTVSEKHVLKLVVTATSTNQAFATVAPGNGPGSFTVTGVSPGSCDITIADKFGNSIEVPVTIQ